MFKKLGDNLAAIAALIGTVGAIGAGFIAFGELQHKVDSLGSLDLSVIEKSYEKQSSEIAVLKKTVEILESQIKEIKLSSGNPLGH